MTFSKNFDEEARKTPTGTRQIKVKKKMKYLYSERPMLYLE